MIHMNGKTVNLAQLRDEARAAGLLPANGELGTFDGFIFTYDGSGNPADFADPAGVGALIVKHSPMREVTDAELAARYNAATNPGIAQRIQAMAQGLVPRDRVPM